MTVHERERCAVQGQVEQREVTAAKTLPKAPGRPSRAERQQASRQGSNTAQFLEFLKRSGGAILKRTHKNPGCQAHSVRGFLSGALGKKMGLTVTSTKAADEERRYSVKN